MSLSPSSLKRHSSSKSLDDKDDASLSRKKLRFSVRTSSQNDTSTSENITMEKILQGLFKKPIAEDEIYNKSDDEIYNESYGDIYNGSYGEIHDDSEKKNFIKTTKDLIRNRLLDNLYTIEPDNIISIEPNNIVLIAQKNLGSMAEKAGLAKDIITKAMPVNHDGKIKEKRNIRLLSFKSMVRLTLAIMLELKKDKKTVDQELLSQMPYNKKFIIAMQTVKESFEKVGIQFTQKYTPPISAKNLLDAGQENANYLPKEKQDKNLPDKNLPDKNLPDKNLEIPTCDKLYAIEPNDIILIALQRSLLSVAKKAGLGNDTIAKALILDSSDKLKEEKNIRPLSVISVIKITLAIMLEAQKNTEIVKEALLSEMPYNEKFFHAMETVKKSYIEKGVQFNNNYDEHIKIITSAGTLSEAIKKLEKINKSRKGISNKVKK